jgi:hypothetical protein
MAVERTIIHGIVKNGLVVPQGDIPLPEGVSVEIIIPRSALSPDAQEEFDRWEQASDEAWGLMEQWEREEQS